MRIKRGVAGHAKHQKIRRATKGMTKSNRSSIKRGKQAVVKALENSTRDRKERKRTFRQLWNTRINAAAKLNGTTYSRLIKGLKDSKIVLDRKILSELAVNEPKVFEAIVKKAVK
jgi:large subunit ribosomal protein L20